MRHSSILSLAFIASLAVELTTGHAEAFIARLNSGPAVIHGGDASFPSPLKTIIFGYAPSFSSAHELVVLTIDPYTGTWVGLGSPYNQISGGWDGDPGADYIDGSAQVFLTCGHAPVTGGIYCSPGSVGFAEFLTYFADDPVRVGTKVFGANTTPVLATYFGISTFFTAIVARGPDGQFWIAYYSQATNSFIDWSRLPSVSGGFLDAPAVTTYAEGLLVVCGRVAVAPGVGCIRQQYANGGSKVWSTWSWVPHFPAIAYRPALAHTSSGVYLFGTGSASPYFEYVSSFPYNGGAWWTDPKQVQNGWDFANGPSAVGTTVSGTDTVFLTGRTSNSAFWYTTGSSTNWNNSWTFIEIP